MFGQLFGIITDVVKVADLAVSVPLAAVRVVTKPVGDLAREVKVVVKEAVKDITE